MPAVSMLTNSYPHVKNVTLSGTPDTMQEIQIGANARRVEIVFTAAAGKVLSSGTDATVITTEESFPVPADSAWYYDIPRSAGSHSVFLASGSASTVASIIVTDGD